MSNTVPCYNSAHGVGYHIAGSIEARFCMGTVATIKLPPVLPVISYNAPTVSGPWPDRGVEWYVVDHVIDNMRGPAGFQTSAVNALTVRLESEMNAVIAGGGDDLITVNSWLGNLTYPMMYRGMKYDDGRDFGSRFIRHQLITPKMPGFGKSPLWHLMTDTVTARIGTVGIRPPSTGSRDLAARAHTAELVRVLPTLRPLTSAVLDRSNSFFAAATRERHGDDIELYRSVVLRDELGDTFHAVGNGQVDPTFIAANVRHSALSAWTAQRRFADDWMGHGNPKLVMTAMVPADCVMISPGLGEAELVISPRSLDRQSSISITAGDVIDR